MNREIKFRAWDGKEMHLPEYSDHEDFCIQSDGRLTEYHEVGYERHLMRFDRKDNWVLMQYTGLKDKNGVEIYEGDILKHDLGDQKYIKLNWQVVFEFGSFQLRTPTENLSISFPFHAYAAIENAAIESEKEYESHLEVIGNICQNHELLNQHPLPNQ